MRIGAYELVQSPTGARIHAYRENGKGWGVTLCGMAGRPSYFQRFIGEPKPIQICLTCNKAHHRNVGIPLTQAIYGQLKGAEAVRLEFEDGLTFLVVNDRRVVGGNEIQVRAFAEEMEDKGFVTLKGCSDFVASP